MTSEQKAAFVIAQAACLMGEIAGMQAENQSRLLHGETPVYLEQAFASAISNSACHHNAVLGLFHD